LNEQLRVAVPFTAPNPIHPSTSHTMRVALERLDGDYALTVELWLVGVPRSMESHSGVAATVEECIAAVEASVAQASPDPGRLLLRGPAVAALVGASLRRVLLEGSSGSLTSTTGSGPIPVIPQHELTRVLVVDANAPVRDLLQIVLDASGFHVVAVEDLPSAAAACDAQAFDVAVIDVDLNGDQGKRVVDLVRACRPPIRPIVVGTGVTHTNSEFAPAAFLQKPFSRRELIEAIRGEMEKAGGGG
jgi:CheY-like chemotaxis protein